MVTGGGDVDDQLHSRDEYIFQLKQEIATLSETIQDLRAENEELRSQPSLALIKEEGVVFVLCGVRETEEGKIRT